MFSFEVNSVTEAVSTGINYLLHEGVEEQSRNGPVLVAPEPVICKYAHPRNRVIYTPTRDANPTFHFMESLWILSGDNDVEFVEYFAKQMRAYSDDGVTSWGAYGWRARRFFGWDQLDAIAAELKTNPTSRRCVMAMWNAMPDYEGVTREKESDFYVATHGGLDVPCNTHAYFAIRNGALNLTVCNRSNDFLWGMTGANAVHFSMMLEYMAMRVGMPVGSYFQFTNNMHAYTDIFSRAKLEIIAHECDTLGNEPAPGPAMAPGFDADLKVFMESAHAMMRSSAPVMMHPMDHTTALFQTVAAPMFNAWYYRKNRMLDMSDRWTAQISAPDWRWACQEWIARRSK